MVDVPLDMTSHICARRHLSGSLLSAFLAACVHACVRATLKGLDENLRLTLISTQLIIHTHTYTCKATHELSVQVVGGQGVWSLLVMSQLVDSFKHVSLQKPVRDTTVPGWYQGGTGDAGSGCLVSLS